jgi:hypothetical protein
MEKKKMRMDGTKERTRVTPNVRTLGARRIEDKGRRRRTGKEGNG